MSIYLPRSLHQRLGERAEAEGSTRTALILIAINRTHDTIGSALDPRPAGGDGADLFDIPQRTARKEPSVETTIRVTDRQLAAIDNLATDHGANRSRLISAALQMYLG
jgi:predicted transcriptional regulator